MFNDPFNFQEHATMRENNGSSVVLPSVASRDVLSEILREGAQRMLAEAVQAEVDEWIDAHRHVVDEPRTPAGRPQRFFAEAARS